MVCVMNQCQNEEEDSHRDYEVGNYNRYLPGSQKTSELSVFNSWQSQRCEQKYRNGKNSQHHDKIGAKVGNVGCEEPTSFEKGKIVIFFSCWVFYKNNFEREEFGEWVVEGKAKDWEHRWDWGGRTE